MDIASLSMSMSQSKTMGEVSTLMLAKSLDSANSLAAGEINIINSAPSPSAAAMENSVNPAVGSNVDVYL